MLLALSIASVCCAAIPAVLTRRNLREYQPPPAALPDIPAISVIVPARNEEAGIAACVQSILLSRDVAVQVLVMDDNSTDETASIVAGLATEDSRLRLLQSAPLPTGWNGKQHACWQAAQVATAPLLCFLDADVRLHPDALARMATLLVAGDGRPAAAARAGLVSGFPHELTETTLEWLLLPLIHFVLLGLLPMNRLRTMMGPEYAAGCGQFLLLDREAYFASGGHAAIRSTMHDGLMLPRLLRRHGYGTRLADMTELASCRMYHSARTTWNGLAKNATEGLAAPRTIVPMTLFLAMGQVLPVPLLVAALVRREPVSAAVAAVAVVLSYVPRLLEGSRFRQRRQSTALHPVGVATLLVLQWYALVRKVAGRPATWKARAYPVG